MEAYRTNNDPKVIGVEGVGGGKMGESGLNILTYHFSFLYVMKTKRLN